jgi:hypothetical protein
MATGTPRFGVRSFARGRGGGVGIDEDSLPLTGGTLAKLSGDGTAALGGITTAAMCCVRAQGSAASREPITAFADGYSVARDPGGTMVSSGLDNIGDRASKAAAARSRSEEGGSDFKSVELIAEASSASGRSDAPGGNAGTDGTTGIDGAVDGGPGGAVGAIDIPVDGIGGSVGNGGCVSSSSNRSRAGGTSENSMRGSSVSGGTVAPGAPRGISTTPSLPMLRGAEPSAASCGSVSPSTEAMMSSTDD